MQANAAPRQSHRQQNALAAQPERAPGKKRNHQTPPDDPDLAKLPQRTQPQRLAVDQIARPQPKVAQTAPDGKLRRHAKHQRLARADRTKIKEQGLPGVARQRNPLNHPASHAQLRDRHMIRHTDCPIPGRQIGRQAYPVNTHIGARHPRSRPLMRQSNFLCRCIAAIIQTQAELSDRQ